MGTDRMGARECYREVILDNIEYSYLVQDSHIDREQLDEIVDLIVDTVCSARKMCIRDRLSCGSMDKPMLPRQSLPVY